MKNGDSEKGEEEEEDARMQRDGARVVAKPSRLLLHAKNSKEVPCSFPPSPALPLWVV